MNRISIFSYASLFLLSLLVLSCTNDADDENNGGEMVTSGCTDERASNYDPDAVEDDGTCEYSRSRYLGDYLGMINCDGALTNVVQSDSLAFSLVEGFDLDDPTQMRIIFENSVLSPVPLTANSIGDSVVVDQSLQQVPLEIGGATVSADIEANGALNLYDNDTKVSGTLMLAAKINGVVDTLFSNCPLEADKLQ